MTVPRRRLSSSLVAAAVLVAAPAAHATEGETDVTGTAFVSFLDARAKGTHVGVGGAVTLRHGLTDVFDGAVELSVTGQPSIDALRLGAAAGIHYIVDVARFRPHLGLLVGVEDLWVLSCDPRPSNIEGVTAMRPPLFDCGHELMPAAIAPLGIEYAPEAPFRIGFAARIVLLPFRSDIPDVLFGTSFGASFAYILDDEP